MNLTFSPILRFIRVCLAAVLPALPLAAAPVVLGPLQTPGNFNRTMFSTSTSVNGYPGFINYGINLNSQTYNVYLPTNYTPSGTYGLITYIDAGDAGTMPAVYQSVLDQHGLIFLAGTGIGNTIDRSTRAGVAVMGSFRMCELHQIDRGRIYLMGNSGGGRMGMDVVYARPDWFSGFIGLSGVSLAGYIPNWAPPGRLQDAPTDNDYWPDNPEYYEVSQMYSYSTTAYRAPPPPVKVAFQAFNDDFRRTELVGTYRYGFMNHGAAVRLVYRNGGHSASNASAFDEAVRFMQHPYVSVLRDRFEDANLATNTDSANTLERGSGFLNRSSGGGAASEANYSYNSKTQKVLRLAAGGGVAAVEAKNRFNWFNQHGIILDVKFRAETQAGDNQQIGIHIARGDSDDTPADNPGLHVFRNHGGKNRLVLIKAGGSVVELARWDYSGTHPMAMATSDKLFWDTAVAPEYAGKTRDFRGEDLRVSADNTGLQLTFSRTITGLETTFASGVILGATARTVTSTASSYYNQSDQEEHPILLQFLWDEMGLRSDVEALAYRHWKLLLSNQALNPAVAAGDALVDEISLIAPAEETNFTAPVISTPGNLVVNATSGQGAIVNFNVTATDDIDGAVAVVCTPPSGTGFPIGTSTVQCAAVDAAGNASSASFTITIQPNGFTPLPPAAPVAAISSTGFGFITLAWNAVPYASTYSVRRATSAAGPYTVVATGISALSFTDTGLVNGVPFFYQIASVNPTGESPPSATVSATPVPGTAAKANNTLDLDVIDSWTTASAPGPGDIALWDATVTNANTTTIGGGVSFSGIRITNPVGNVTIQPGSGGNLTLGAQGIDMSSTSSTLAISANTVLAAAQTWHTGTSSITATGVLSGTGSLAKSGSGILSLSGNNSACSGEITIKEGTLRYGGSVINIPVFGSGRIHLGEANGSASATLDFSITSSTSVANPITISSGSGGRFIRSNMGNTAGHTLSGSITGSNDLTFAAGVVTYSGASAATFTGNLFVTGGKLRLANGSTFNSATILAIASGATVDLNASGSSWNFAGLNDISGTGGTLANAGGTRTINLRGGGNYAFSGNVQSNINLVVNLSGTGSQILAGNNNTYTGTTTVTAGKLLVNGTKTGTAAMTVASVATLGGNGSIASPVTLNGTLAPGDGPGTLTLNSSLAMAATAKLAWELPGNAASGGDRLTADTVTVASGAALDLLFNSPGSTVDFSNAFWTGNRTMEVMVATGMSGGLSLGTVSLDSTGKAAAGYGVFSVLNSSTGVALQWTAYSTVERWRYQYFGITGNTGNAADGADPDIDGFTNAQEFTNGTNPTVADVVTSTLTLGITSPQPERVTLPLLESSLELAASVVVGGAPAIPVIGWTTVSGPGSAVFIPADGAVTRASFPAPGTYVIQVQASVGSGPQGDVETLTRTVIVAPPADMALRQGVNGYSHTATFLRNDGTNATWNSGARDQLLAGYNNTGAMRAVFSFDLASLPAGFTVHSAALDLWTSNIAGLGTVGDLTLHPLAATPTEGTGNSDSNKAIGADTGATWIRRTDAAQNLNWTSPGGDYNAASVLATVPGYAATATDQARKAFVGSAAFVAGVEAARSAASPLNLMLVSNTVSGTNFTRFHSDDSSDVTRRPMLTLGFTDHPVPALDPGAAPSAAPGQSVPLAGSAVDATSTLWSLVSGPGTALFGNAASAATTVTFSVQGMYTLRMRAANAHGEASRTLVVTVAPALDAAVFADWQALAWPGITDPATIDPEQDPDGDGVENLIEWALGLDPKIPGVVPHALAHSGGGLQFSYIRRRIAPGEAVYQVEWSDTMAPGSWSTAGVGAESTDTGGMAEHQESVVVPVPAGSAGHRFYRLRVRRP